MVTRVIKYIIIVILFPRTIHQSYGILCWTVIRITQMEPRVEIECNIVSLWGFVNRISRGARKKCSNRGLKGDTSAISEHIRSPPQFICFVFSLLYYYILVVYFLCTGFVAISTPLNQVGLPIKFKKNIINISK